MSPIRVDTTKTWNIDQILKTIQPQTATIKANKNSSKLNFKEFIEQELNAPKAAAIKQAP